MGNFAGGSATGIGFATALANATGLSQRLLGKMGPVQFVGKSGVILQLDATTAEDHSREATVTSFPIEGGGSINDHVVMAPAALSITGTISDTPLKDLKSLLTESVGVPLAAALGPLGSIVGGSAFGLYKALQGSKSPSILAFAQLCKLQAGDEGKSTPTPPEPFDVLTGLKRYPSMVIQSLSVPRGPQTGGCLVFTVKLVQLNVVSPQSVPIAVFSNPKLAAAKQSTGDQDTQPLEGASAGYATEQVSKFSKVARGVP